MRRIWQDLRERGRFLAIPLEILGALAAALHCCG